MSEVMFREKFAGFTSENSNFTYTLWKDPIDSTKWIIKKPKQDAVCDPTAGGYFQVKDEYYQELLRLFVEDFEEFFIHSLSYTAMPPGSIRFLRHDVVKNEKVYGFGS